MGWEHGGRRMPEGLYDTQFEFADDAECRRAGVDVNVFFEENRNAPNEKALFYCRRCPVQKECADYAWDNGIPYGIYGGVRGDQRTAGIRYMPAQVVVVDNSALAVRVLTLHRAGMSWRAISRDTGVHSRTIFRILSQHQENASA